MKDRPTKVLKNILFSVFTLIFITLAHSQGDSSKAENNFWQQVRFGGGIGLSIGNAVFSATLAPSAVYDFNRQFSLGVGLNGTYYRQKNAFKSTILGGSVISLFNPIQEIQLSGEFEQNHVSQNFDAVAFQDDSYWVPALFVGMGYRVQQATIGLRYDVLYDNDKSVYATPWAPFIRVYF
ncbi:alpha-ketoglutarate decarboxylase [Lacinutrix neustonica]|uniref:Alpha-ketoglutarate decarboxylase n=1 Tax=Lacinutrix neustonica TaxID=2980107 RepID=A0A9E8MY47_9FLAO|nr:alpha-ketoglutarate decarboxylase [Lacinutrix neustonica]WAC03838.1 alpha-ketoglutarate decarboxylase [Lacinutrix neustonica]